MDEFCDRTRMHRSLAWSSIDRKRIPLAVRKTTESGVWNCPTLTMWHQLKPAKAFEEALEGPAGWHVARRQVRHWRERVRRMARGIPSILAGNPARVELVSALHKGGARLVAGTDVGMPLVPAGRSLHWELAHFVKAGMIPHEALKTATNAAAECLGREAFGRLRVGLRADLVLLDASPLEKIEHVSRIAGVMTRGKWLSSATLAERLAQLDGSTRAGWER